MKPHKIYSGTIDPAALNQFYDAMEQECVVQGALMPDAHKGYSLPIGAVIATQGMVFPSWVGYDIGCGMCAVPTTFNVKDIREHADEIFDEIYSTVPVGFEHNKTVEDWKYSGDMSAFASNVLNCGLAQLGTLGGGNHFIEIGYDENDTVWIIIHSGSRNVGHKLASHYMKIASGSDKAKEGHYGLDVTTLDGRNYIADLNMALEFALENRKRMIMRVKTAIQKFVKGHILDDQLINRNHNHAEYKDGLWVHRKGATHAEDGMMGVIPGNMRDGSFIVRGKGCAESLCSSSHGAGRVLGRAEAKRQLDIDIFKADMLEHKVKARVALDTLDESAYAYKNIFGVMEMQEDLVDVCHHVLPLINIKG